jgi:hypothetical protein
LCGFEDEQYPSYSVDPLCLIIEYPIEGIIFLIGFVGLCNTLPHVKIYVMEHNVFLGYLKRGVACSLNLFGHEQYLFNSLDQNNLTHGVYNVAH